MSNLACRIAKHYWAAAACSIMAVLFLGFFAGSATASAGKRFCVLVPHFKDEYWLSVGFGLEQEAARQNVELLIYEAGGYNALSDQIKQIDLCAKAGVDAILLGGVSSDDHALMAAVTQVARDIPVFGLVNEFHAKALRGQVGVNWRDMGYAIGRHLSELHPAGSPPKTAVLISGPAAAGWTGPLEVGLRAGLLGSTVRIVEVLGADTGLRQQLALVETALQRHPDADYLIGSAPAIEAAIGIFATREGQPHPLLLSTYISHTVLRGLMNGNVFAAAFDDPMMQGVMAVKQAVSLQGNGDPAKMIGPDIQILSHTDAHLDQVRISPSDYFPAIH